MCGIVACLAAGPAEDYLIPALEALEYRGYDSVGVAIRRTDGTAMRVRSILRIEELAHRLETIDDGKLTGCGIGHTRWATHGGVSERNAHPHLDCTQSLSVVHNGIIENADNLRARLEALGHEFSSDVDSEVVTHLLEDELRDGADLVDALAHVIAECEGASAIVAMDAPSGRIVGATHRAPLVVASSASGAFFASDVAAISAWIDTYQVLRDGDVVELAPSPRWSGSNVESAETITSTWSDSDRDLGGYADHMAKEIAEQPELAARILERISTDAARGELWRSLQLPPFERIAILGCGTSLNAGGVVASAFRRFGRIPTTTIIASEADEAILEPGTLIVAMSQSGETADVLSALDGTSCRGQSVLALTNNPNSSLARRADAVVECTAGHEIGVAATKTFVAQVLTGVSLAISSLRASDRLTRRSAYAIMDDLQSMPDILIQALAVSNQVVPALAAQLSRAPGIIFLGRGSGVVYAAEGALKLKELTYRWAEHFPAGELKHGPLALIEDGTPVVVIDAADARISGNIEEVRARGARVITIGATGSSIPALGRGIRTSFGGAPAACGPLESVVPMQVLARELAINLGRDVDKPRNLAKSVTVE